MITNDIMKVRNPLHKFSCWYMFTVAVICGIFALIALWAAMFKGAKMSAPMFSLAAAATIAWMAEETWNYSALARNVGVCLAAAISYIALDFAGLKLGLGVYAKAPVVLFVAFSMSYYTSPEGLAAFRKKSKDDEGNDGGGSVATQSHH